MAVLVCKASWTYQKVQQFQETQKNYNQEFEQIFVVRCWKKYYSQVAKKIDVWGKKMCDIYTMENIPP